MKPITIRSPAGTAVVFDPPMFLAPMEGITDAAFRRLMIGLGGIGGACTDFVRVAGAPFSARALRRRLGPVDDRCPVGLQVMAADPDHLAASITNAEIAGAAFIDLNFGCPAPTVFKNRAGSALLDQPQLLADMVRVAVEATQVPVTVKMRVGVADDSRLEEVLDAAAGAGATLIALHGRRKVDPYTRPARWQWITRAVDWLATHYPDVPLVGNGSVRTPADVDRLMAETACHGVMIGLGILADPYIFARTAGLRPEATAVEVADFALRYADSMLADRGERVALARLKQLIRNLAVGGLFPAARTPWLRTRSLPDLLAWFQAVRSGDLAAPFPQDAGQGDQGQPGDGAVVGTVDG